MFFWLSQISTKLRFGKSPSFVTQQFSWCRRAFAGLESFLSSQSKVRTQQGRLLMESGMIFEAGFWTDGILDDILDDSSILIICWHLHSGSGRAPVFGLGAALAMALSTEDSKTGHSHPTLHIGLVTFVQTMDENLWNIWLFPVYFPNIWTPTSLPMAISYISPNRPRKWATRNIESRKAMMKRLSVDKCGQNQTACSVLDWLNVTKFILSIIMINISRIF